MQWPLGRHNEAGSNLRSRMFRGTLTKNCLVKKHIYIYTYIIKHSSMKQIKQISSPIFSDKFMFRNLVLVAKQHGVLDWCRVWPSKMPSVAIGPIIPFPTSCFLLTSVVCCFPMVVYHRFTHVFWFQLSHMMITYDRCCGMLLLDSYVQQQGRVVSQSIYSIETTPGTLFINHGFATTIMFFFYCRVHT